MIKKGLLAGLAALISGFLLNFIVNAVFPSVAQEYQNTALFRPWSDPLMTVYFAYPFILGIVAAYLWGLLKEHLKGSHTDKAFQFAKTYFIIATVPGMFISYTCFQISLPIILTWTVSGFVQAYVVGYVFARMQ